MSREHSEPLTESLGPGREFDAIRGFLRGMPPLPPGVRVGPGDDSAVLDGGWVLSTDLYVEDVHFRRGWLADAEIGYRATVAALSDLAAMAAEPVGILVSFAAAAGSEALLDAVHTGVREAVESVGGCVLGGDTTSSPGPLILDVIAVGITSSPVMRAGASAGDELWVTGTLGASAAALSVLERGGEPGPELRAAFARPVPRVREALWLSERAVLRAMIDLSDGLAGDAGHLAAAGGVRIVLEEGRIPVSQAAATELGVGRAREAALHGGEDYELCFVAEAGAVDPDAFSELFGEPLTRVGSVEEGAGVWLEGPGGPVELRRGGFDHFAEGGT